jgi:hypothetical protein
MDHPGSHENRSPPGCFESGEPAAGSTPGPEPGQVLAVQGGPSRGGPSGADVGDAVLRDAVADLTTWWPDTRFDPQAAGVDVRPDLENADLRSSYLRRDDLTGVSLRGAQANAFTEWPDGFDWRQAGSSWTTDHSRQRADAVLARPSARSRSSISSDSLRAPDRDRRVEVLNRGKHAAPTQVSGNLCGNPGGDTRHYRTAPDEIGPAHEQPGRVQAGPVGGFRSVVIGRSRVRIPPRAPNRRSEGLFWRC